MKFFDALTQVAKMFPGKFAGFVIFVIFVGFACGALAVHAALGTP